MNNLMKYINEDKEKLSLLCRENTWDYSYTKNNYRDEIYKNDLNSLFLTQEGDERLALTARELLLFDTLCNIEMGSHIKSISQYLPFVRHKSTSKLNEDINSLELKGYIKISKNWSGNYSKIPKKDRKNLKCIIYCYDKDNNIINLRNINKCKT